MSKRRRSSGSPPATILHQVYSLRDVDTMEELLRSRYAHKRSWFRPGREITAYNKMDRGRYTYTLTAPYGRVRSAEFQPEYTPAQMLRMGIFNGKYLNDCILEFPREWFQSALKHDKLCPEGADPEVNYFGVRSGLSLHEWRRRKWLIGPDNRGWFQWYCRYYCGRRDPEVDEKQIKRWRAIQRHYAQVRKNCRKGDRKCRPVQRQALLHWSYKIH